MSSWLGVVITFAVTEDMYVPPAEGRAYNQFYEWLLGTGYVFNCALNTGQAHPVRVDTYSIKNMQPRDVEEAFRRMPWCECATLVMQAEGSDAVHIHYAGPDTPASVSGPQS